MLTTEHIHQTMLALVAAAQAPRQLILFGSYARGEAKEGSDLDLLLVEDESADIAEETVRLQRVLGRLPVEVDLLVYSEREFEQRRDWCSTPVYWAVREGKVLYDRGQ